MQFGITVRILRLVIYHTINLLAQSLPLLILASLILNVIMWIQSGLGVTFAGRVKGLLGYIIVYIETISDVLERPKRPFLEVLLYLKTLISYLKIIPFTLKEAWRQFAFPCFSSVMCSFRALQWQDQGMGF